MRKKILEFINSERQDFLDFWREIFPAKQTYEIKKVPMYEEKPFKKSLDNGIYKNVCEIDFIEFSHSVLKKHVKDKKVIEAIKIIDSLPESLRKKKLRINFFLNFNYPLSGLYDPITYQKTTKDMVEYLKKVYEIVEKHNKEIISINFDSIMFISTEEEGKKILDKINKEIYPIRLRLKYYETVIKFLNIIMKDDETVLTTKKDAKYEIIKQKIINLIKENKFGKAIELVNNSEISNKTKNKYIKVIESVAYKKRI